MRVVDIDQARKINSSKYWQGVSYVFTDEGKAHDCQYTACLLYTSDAADEAYDV